MTRVYLDPNDPRPARKFRDAMYKAIDAGEDAFVFEGVNTSTQWAHYILWEYQKDNQRWSVYERGTGHETTNWRVG